MDELKVRIDLTFKVDGTCDNPKEQFFKHLSEHLPGIFLSEELELDNLYTGGIQVNSDDYIEAREELAVELEREPTVGEILDRMIENYTKYMEREHNKEKAFLKRNLL